MVRQQVWHLTVCVCHLPLLTNPPLLPPPPPPPPPPLPPDGSDYISEGSIDLIFGPSVTRESIHIAILDDEVIEEDETFTVVLSSSSSGVELDPATATVNITDNGE